MTTRIGIERTTDEAIVSTLDTVAAGLAVRALARPEIAKAMERARYALSIVVTDAASLTMATGALLDLQAGTKRLAESKKPLAVAINSIKAAVAEKFAGYEEPVAEAVKYLSEQVKAYLEAERKASEVARAAESARLRAAEEAARQGDGEGGPPAPPPAQRYIPPTVTQVKAGPQGSVHLTHTLEIVAEDFSRIPETMLQLDAAAARGWAQDQIRKGLLDVPKDGTEVRVIGLVLKYRTDLAKRVS
jgi:hypothetical protein